MTRAARPPTRRYVKGEQTREQILQAAKSLFMHRGYYNTSTNELFRKAGISRGAFYHHWRTKEELALTILEELKAAYGTHVFPLRNSAGRARDVIEQALRKMRELNSRPDWVYCRLMVTWSSELGEKEDRLGHGVREMRGRWLDFWETLLARAQREGDLRADISAKELSFLVMGALAGVWIGDRNGGSTEGHDVHETLRRMLFA